MHEMWQAYSLGEATIPDSSSERQQAQRNVGMVLVLLGEGVASSMRFAVLILLMFAPSAAISPPSDFHAIQIRSGNSVEGYAQVKSAYAESDFRLTRDNVLVSAHDPVLTGNCGIVAGKSLSRIRNCTLGSGRHVATLGEFLKLDLQGWYIDLKDTDSLAVKVAVAEIKRLNREDGAVLLLYDASPEVVSLIHRNDIRAMMKDKGGIHRAEQLIVKARRYGFEGISADIRKVDARIIALAGDLRVIASDANRFIGRWETLLGAGLDGLIVSDPELAETMAGSVTRAA